MSWLLAFSETIAEYLWSASLYISIIIGIIWMIDSVSKHSSSRFKYLLWCIIPLRLIIPFNVGIPLFKTGDLLPDFGSKTALSMLQPGISAEAMETASSSMTFFSIAGMIWLISVLFIGIYILSRIIILNKDLKACDTVSRPDIFSFFHELKQRMGIRRNVGLYISKTNMVDFPGVTGIFRPKILLPQTMAETWHLKDIQPVIMHELAHVRRNDLALNWIQIVIQTVFFFHPLIWFANKRIRRIREELCDDTVLSMLGNEWKIYLSSILRIMEETVKKPKLCYIRVGIFQKKNNVKERIERVIKSHYSPNQKMTFRSAMALIVLTLMFLSIASAMSIDVIIDNKNVLLKHIEKSAAENSIDQVYTNSVSFETKQITFAFSLRESGTVSLYLYNLQGSQAAFLIDNKELNQGIYELEWNYDLVPPGIYLYKFVSGDFNKVMKIILN